jgi:phosphoglycolate phosphatase-like HAD superfamily hydrolase
MARSTAILLVAVLAVTGWGGRAHAQAAPADPLPSWNEGPTKQRIVAFVKDATTTAGPRFVAPEQRVATFDQDGTLWTEHPLYTQAMFALDRLKRLAPDHPEWRDKEPFKSVLAGDRETITRLTEHDWTELLAVTHAGMTTEQFLALSRDWLATARDPRFHQPYTRLVYQPMLELMAYLRANGFKTFIVTGGGQEFVRSYSQDIYGIPPEQVVGSSIATRYEMQPAGPVLMREPSVFFIDDHDGKAIGINLFIGVRPAAAFGNSDGDREMLEWTTGGGTRANLGLLVMHDDAAREYAYGPASGLADTKVGTFPQTLLDEARARDWAVVSMKRDWKRIFSFGP